VADQRLTRAALLELLPLAAIALAVRREQGLPGGRCLLCRDRPAHLVDPDPYEPPDRRQPLVTAEQVAACQCGWAPTYIRIGYQDPRTGEHLSTAELFARVDAERAR